MVRFVFAHTITTHKKQLHKKLLMQAYEHTRTYAFSYIRRKYPLEDETHDTDHNYVCMSSELE